MRRCIGALIVVLLIVATIRIGDFDARAEILLGAWTATWMAAAIWFLTDLRSWFWKIFFGLAVFGSIGGATIGLGLWHTKCFEQSEQSSSGSFSFSYCLPRLGPSPDFR